MTELPPVLDPTVNIRRLLALDRMLTQDEIASACLNVGRNEAPWVVYCLFTARRLPLDVAAYVVADAWSGAEFPLHKLTQAMWREMFEFTGYTVNGERAARPTEPLELFRGSKKRHRRRWSWTSDRAMAERFAGNRAALFVRDDEPTFVWRALVPPQKLYAGIGVGGYGRSESEYVVDTRGVKIEQVPMEDIARAPVGGRGRPRAEP